MGVGRNERIRTSDPLVPNEVRYQAALHSVLYCSMAMPVQLFYLTSAVWKRSYRLLHLPCKGVFAERNQGVCRGILGECFDIPERKVRFAFGS